jgi:hypothetical protein
MRHQFFVDYCGRRSNLVADFIAKVAAIGAGDLVYWSANVLLYDSEKRAPMYVHLNTFTSKVYCVGKILE